MSDSTYRLLQRCSWMADCIFKQRRGRFLTQLWLTENADGRCARFETSCQIDRSEADDAAVLQMLQADQAADFAYDRITRFAVAYAARVTKTGSPLLRAPPQFKREAIVLEGHDNAGAHLVMVRDVIERERGFYLTAPEWVDATNARFADLLPGAATRADGAGLHAPLA